MRRGFCGACEGGGGRSMRDVTSPRQEFPSEKKTCVCVCVPRCFSAEDLRFVVRLEEEGEAFWCGL